MIRVGNPELSFETLTKLALWQRYVDSSPNYVIKVERAKLQFQLANRAGSATFSEIKNHLSAMCSGARRCMYCEDSVADEIEHHHPKDLYPEKTFEWTNLLYACGPCNGPKNNRFAILTENGLESVSRRPREAIRPPKSGPYALIHPRFEDPLEYLLLDLAGQTFRFTAHPLADDGAIRRAEYTIDVLGLNKKDFLLAARREAFHSYLSRLRDYARTSIDPHQSVTAAAQREAILRMQHPTVLREIFRQAAFLPQVAEILRQSPEIATW